MTEAAQQRITVWLIFAAALVVYHAIFVLFFPTGFGEIGHDYMLALPGFYDGAVWFSQNSLLDVPWFTPSFCGGQPFFADPQSAYYSLTQALIFLLPPVTALHVTLLILVSISYWGTYLFARHVLAMSIWCAALAGVFFMFNGFLSHRWIVGHTGFQGFALVPVIACLLVMRRELPIGPVRWGGNALLAGLCIAYWPQSGLGSLIIPAALSVFSLALIAGLQGQSLLPFFKRSAAAGGIAVALSFAKLNAAFAMLSQFPRTDYKLPGLDSFVSSLSVAFTALNMGSLATFNKAQQHLQNTQWALNSHEWAYSLTPVPMTLLVLAGIYLVAQNRTQITINAARLLGIAALALTLALPIAINIYTPAWNDILKATPLLQSNSSLFRWYIIYIPILCLAAPFLLDKVLLRGGLVKIQHWLVGALIVTTLGFHAFDDRTYYFFTGAGLSYKPVTRAWHALKAGNSETAIDTISTSVLTDHGTLRYNEVMYAGASQPTCYNPIFGYRLENLPLAPLTLGPVLSEPSPGVLNMKNPACYVFPEENDCKPGDHFRLDQADALERFRQHKPFPFAVSQRQQVANLVTSVSLSLAALALIAMLAAMMTQWGRQLLSTRSKTIG